jgi:arylsulfatase A-like enzyme
MAHRISAQAGSFADGLRHIAASTLVLAGSCLALANAQAPAVELRANVLLFVVDDLGWQDISLALHSERTPFNARYRTPNLERLAAQGMRFTQAYAAAPVCTPTRAALATGLSPAQLHVTYWTLQAGKDTSAAQAVVAAPDWRVDGLQPKTPTLGRAFQQAGYRTIHVGKWHLGAIGTPGADPTLCGFDVNVAGHGAGAPGSYFGRDNFSSAPGRAGTVWDVPGLESYHGKDVYLTEVLAQRAVAELELAAQSKQPFFLQFAPYAVHAPIQANPRYLEHYAQLDPREAAYATMIETVDAALGDLLATLDRLGVADNTVVVFTSDNGGLSAHARGGQAHTHNAPLRSGKGSYYEGGLRVPLVVRWPGRTALDSRCDVPVISHDLYPTLLAASAGTAPAPATPLEGRDLTSLLRGGDTLGERSLFWHMPHFWGVEGPGIEPVSALRRGDWKLIWRHADQGFELYDLASDISEIRDLAAIRPQRVRALATELAAQLKRVDAQLSLDKRTQKPLELLLPPAPQRPPNIVQILADDIGWDDLSCYGATDIATPNIDRLAAEGLRFTSFYAPSSTCTPTRAALMTGCYAQRVGLQGVLFPDARIGLADEEITLAEVLRSRGYTNACIGKWHLGHLPEFLPTRHGFDLFFGIPYPNDHGPERLGGALPRVTRGFPAIPLLRNELALEVPAQLASLPTRFADEAVRFIAENAERPFYLHYSNIETHTPWLVGRECQSYSQAGVYGDAVQCLDAAVGRILDALDEQGLRENTLVVFQSDNGPLVHAYAELEGIYGHAATVDTARHHRLREGKYQSSMRPTRYWSRSSIVTTTSAVASPVSSISVSISAKM